MKSRRSQKLRILLILTLALVMLSHESTLTQGDTGSTLVENGYAITGVFLEGFKRFGGLEILGYPISNRFVDQGVEVQYFQRGRLEWHPDHPEPYQVQLGLLGEDLRYRQDPLSALPKPSARRVYFPETGHSVAYAFLDFFRDHGGIDTFGYPITEVLREEGQVVQYFQRLKMVWYPDVPDSKVQVANLGELYALHFHDRMPSDAFARADETAAKVVSPVVSPLSLAVSLRGYVLSPGRDQVISVLALDEQNAPVSGALVNVELETANGRALNERKLELASDGQGLAQLTVPVRDVEQGVRIVVRIAVSHGDATAEEETSFLVW